MSLPAWECGLKFRTAECGRVKIKSLPAWECGLKLCTFLHIRRAEPVTPCVGVWIEIHPQNIVHNFIKVTPCVGVWIEMYNVFNTGTSRSQSLPAWECGLKLCRQEILPTNCRVTPCVGVWIEIKASAIILGGLASLPAWECGLKFSDLQSNADNIESLPAWECGLKWVTDTDRVVKLRHSLRGSVD